MKLQILFLAGLFVIPALRAKTQTNVFPANGNVGIGTAAPGYKLDVNGDLQLFKAIENPFLIFHRIDWGYTKIGQNGPNLEFLNTIYHPAAGINFLTKNSNGETTSKFSITNSGNVGIGTDNPLTKLQIGNFDNGGTENQLLIPGTYNFEQLRLGQIGNGNQALEFVNHTDLYSSYGIRFLIDVDHPASGLQIQYSPPRTSYSDLSYSTGFYLGLNGNVGIGTTIPDSKLTVAGKIHSQEVKVSINAGADFVFDKDYHLTCLTEIEDYIQANKHLPEVASAAEMEKNGIDLGKMNIQLLQKIEELTMYLIQKDKELAREKILNANQEKRLAALEKEINNNKK